MARRISPQPMHLTGAAASVGVPPPAAGPPAPPAAGPPPSPATGDALSQRVSRRGSVLTPAPKPRALAGWGELEPAFQDAAGAAPVSEKITPVLFESLDVTKLVEFTGDGAGGGVIPQDAFLDDDRRQIIATERPPWCWVCSLLITTGDDRRCLGSGWVVGPRTVVTAGHCVYTRRGGWVKRVEILVGRNEASRLSAHVSSDLHMLRWLDGGEMGVRLRGRSPCRSNPDPGELPLPGPLRPGTSDVALRPCRRVSSRSKSRGDLVGLRSAPDRGAVPGFAVPGFSTFGGQSGAPVFYKTGEDRYAVGIHTYGGPQANYATRITDDVYTNIKAWIQMSSGK